MAVDYNLVVIGGSLAGIEAAKLAASCYARVALVRQDERWDGLGSCLVFLRSLADRAPALQDLWRSDGSVDWGKASQYWQLVARQQQAPWRDDRLMALGIDVISAAGAFQRKPRVGFGVDDRWLTANSYLLALSDVNSLATFPDALEQLQDVRRLGIVGDRPEAVAIAQSLARLGIAVSLVIPSMFLAGFDGTLVRLCKAQLEADGVRFVDTIAGQEYDLVIQPKPVGNSQLESLNLSAVRVRWNQQGILCDRYYRASRKVYTCGNSIPIAQNVVYHALQFRRRMPSTPMPMRYLVSQPSLVSIGVTEELAPRKIRILERSIQPNLKAQLHNQSSGICKIILNQQGQLMGAHVLGYEAEEWAAVLALAVEQRVSIEQLAQLSVAVPSLAAIVGEMAREERKVRSGLQQYALEEFLSWQRYWGR